MNLAKILDKVDVERLYQHVLNLEGTRHPLDTPEKLKEAADYIYAELQGYGTSVRMQEFQVEGFPDTFLNVEGWIGDKGRPSAAIMNHYDTVYNTMGANDNAAAVAVMLEAARVLAQEQNVPPIRFLSFSLEEGNPAFQSRLRTSAQKLDLVDEQQRYTSYQISKIMQEHTALVDAVWNEGKAGKSYSEAIAEATGQLEAQIPDSVFQHLKEVEAVYAGVTAWPGQYSHLGAWAWVDEALKLNKKIEFGICLDEIGRVYKEEGSQTLPPELTWEMLHTYKVDQERMIGDWAFIITDGAAEKLGQAFCAHCRRDSIDLPHAYFHIPMNYEQITKELPQAIGSDYSAFWHAGIPALFLFDTASWRKPYRGHTMADTIDRLDFDQTARICKATIATVIDPRT